MNLYKVKYKLGKIIYVEKNQTELEDSKLLYIVKFGYSYDWKNGLYIIDINRSGIDDVFSLRLEAIKLLREEKLNQLI